MAELSKTARQSMGKVEKKEAVAESLEEAIRQLRLNLDAKLYVTPDRIRALLTAYDALDTAFTAEHEQVLKLTGDNIALSVELTREKGAVATLAEATSGLLKRAEAAEAELMTMADAAVGMIEAIIPEAIVPLDSIKMAEIPAQHEDEHHMVDFGHDTIHSQAEGGS